MYPSTWLIENNLEDVAFALERLEDEDDHHALTTTEMPSPSTSSFLNALVLPLASQPPSASVHGGRVALGRGSQPLVPT